MGVWGTGLYSGDFAMDLRSTIGALVRLPFDADRIVDIACETEPSAATNPQNEEHTTFWLVLADQFAKRGIPSDRVRTKALTIIDSGEDLAVMAKVGMPERDIRKRGAKLNELRSRIAADPAEAKPRNTLRSPQPFVMEVGDVLVYPTCAGRCINPYFPSKEKDYGWAQDGWAAMVVIDCGRAFEYLAWYRAVISWYAFAEQPSLASLTGGEVLWRFDRPGTCSANHFRKMELEKIGMLAIDREKVKNVFPTIKPGISAAVQDISIANSMRSVPETDPKPAGSSKGHTPRILGIEQILS